MKTITREQAKSLAVSYHGFHEAINGDNITSQWCWATQLLESQKATGITIIDNGTLERIIERTNAELKKEGE